MTVWGIKIFIEYCFWKTYSPLLRGWATSRLSKSGTLTTSNMASASFSTVEARNPVLWSRSSKKISILKLAKSRVEGLRENHQIWVRWMLIAGENPSHKQILNNPTYWCRISSHILNNNMPKCSSILECKPTVAPPLSCPKSLAELDKKWTLRMEYKRLITETV